MSVGLTSPTFQIVYNGFVLFLHDKFRQEPLNDRERLNGREEHIMLLYVTSLFPVCDYCADLKPFSGVPQTTFIFKSTS